jgi:hypothetical protein
VAQACNSSYSRGRDGDSRPAQAKSPKLLLRKIAKAKRDRGVAQVVECLTWQGSEYCTAHPPAKKEKKNSERSWIPASAQFTDASQLPHL